MASAADSKNDVAARQTDLDQNVASRHFGHESFGRVFVEDVGSVSDA